VKQDVDPVAAPTLGQHNGEILRRILRYDAPKIAAAIAGGAFGPISGNRIQEPDDPEK
jgi:hypothetical protein